MKRTLTSVCPAFGAGRYKSSPANPDGCTEAILTAHDIPAEVLIELVRGGLVVARSERRNEEDSFCEVTQVLITEAGERVLAART